MPTFESQDIAAYGWTALPRSVDALLASRRNVLPLAPLTADEIGFPDSEIVGKVLEYAKRELPEPTLNHSMRVYYYGIAIARFSFPHLLTPTFTTTYLLAALLHDIGTTPSNICSTLLSFEFHGGLLSLELLKGLGAPAAQAEAVAEAVIRHQDLGETGTVTSITALIQLATIFDNVCKEPIRGLVHRDTIADVVGKWPRFGWSACFAGTIREEMRLKPWAHTSHLGAEEFEAAVLGNVVMAEFE